MCYNPNQDGDEDDIERWVRLSGTWPVNGNRVYPWNFSATIDADTPRDDPIAVGQEFNYNGIIREVVLGWSEGSQQAVGIQLRSAEGEKFIPRNEDADYIALDDHVLTVPLNVEFEAGDVFEARYINNDPEEPHYANVLAIAEEVE